MCDEVPASMTLTLSWKFLLLGICVLLQTVPQVALLRLKATSPESTKILLQWETSPEEDAETVEGYEITYREVGSPVMEAFTIQETHRKETLLKSLRPFTEYSISVKTVSSHGIGRITTIDVKTLEGIPEKPSILYCDEITSTSFRIHWETGVTNGILSSYQVILKTGSAYRTFAFTDNLTNLMSANISELVPYRSYELRVRAGTAMGFSEYSSPHTCLTDTAAPSVPQQLQVSVLSPSSIFVKWHTPKMFYKSIASYVIEIYEGNSLENPDVHWVEGPIKLEETITGLTTNRQYRLRVAAVTQSLYSSYNYTGDFSEEVIFDLEGQTNSTTAPEGYTATVKELLEQIQRLIKKALRLL